VNGPAPPTNADADADVDAPDADADDTCGCNCGYVYTCGYGGWGLGFGLAMGIDMVDMDKGVPLRRLPVLVLVGFSLFLPFPTAAGGGADTDGKALPVFFAGAPALALPPFVVDVDFLPLSFFDSSR